MPLYRYKARDKEGSLHAGIMDARGREAVADQLSGQGFIPVLIEEQKAPFLQPDFLRGFQKVKPQDLIVFSRQLATLVGAGIPFIQSLGTMELQTESVPLKKAISGIRRELESGASFSESLAKYPRIFSSLYVSMIRAGETAGVLDEILSRLAMIAEHDADIRARLKAAVRYPLIVVVTICIAFTFLVSFVIPRFAMVYERFKTALPLPTRILIGINYVAQLYWYVVLGGVALIIWGTSAYVSTPRGRRQWDTMKLKLPIFGILFKKVALSRFARTFAAMQKSGISMMLTLEIAGEIVGNVVIARVVEQMRESLSQGRGLTGPMQESGLFPPLVVQMVSVGEETGHLDTMLNKVSDYYDMDVDYALRNLSTMIEPILLFFVGGMVLFLALGIFLPMWNLLNLFKR